MKVQIDAQIRDSSNNIYRTVDNRKVTSIRDEIDLTGRLDDVITLDEWARFETFWKLDNYRAICKEGSIINIEVYDAKPSSISQTHIHLYSRHNDGRFIKH